MKYLITIICSLVVLINMPVYGDHGGGPEFGSKNTSCGTYHVKRVNIGGYDDRDRGRAIGFVDADGDAHRVDDHRNLGDAQGTAMLSMLTTAYLTGRTVKIASTHSDCRDFSEIELQ